MKDIKEIISRTQADAPSVEVVFEDGASWKLVLGSTHDWKVKDEKGESDEQKNIMYSLGMSYHHCFGKGYDKKKFIRMMKKDLEKRFLKKETENETDKLQES